MDVYQKHVEILGETLTTYLECLAKLDVNDMKKDGIAIVDKLRRIDRDIDRLKESVVTFKNSMDNDSFKEDYEFEKKCDIVHQRSLSLALLQIVDST